MAGQGAIRSRAESNGFGFHGPQNETSSSDDPTSPFLSWFSVSCIIAQRMIGTGIFVTPTLLLQNGNSIGATIILWVMGGIAAVAGAQLYLEYAMRLPIHKISQSEGDESKPKIVHLPRSGGELVYLTYIFDRFKFFVSCEFGIVFVLIGNSAANCTSFAYHLYVAINHQTTDITPSSKGQWIITGIALGTAISVCCLHILGRDRGIWINNFFACVKGLILLFIILLGFISLSRPSIFKNASHNLDTSYSFNGLNTTSFNTTSFNTTSCKTTETSKTSNINVLALGSSFLEVAFSYGGWNQANYVLGEVENPSKYFRKTTLYTVSLVSLLYILTIISYMIVVPLSGQTASTLLCDQDYIITAFFDHTLGQLIVHTKTMAYLFLAFSSLGNVIVTTYTAARVKQEVAKEGVFFYTYSIYIARTWKTPKWVPKLRWLSKESPEGDNSNSTEQAAMLPVPASALILHSAFSVILILIERSLQPNTAYAIFLGIYSYLIDNLIPFILGVSLILMCWKGTNWNNLYNTPGKTSKWSLISAVIVVIISFYVLALSWVQIHGEGHYATNGVPWFYIPAVLVGILFLAFCYWFILLQYHRRAKPYRRFLSTRTPTAHEHPNHYWIQTKEKVELQWVDNSERQKIPPLDETSYPRRRK